MVGSGQSGPCLPVLPRPHSIVPALLDSEIRHFHGNKVLARFSVATTSYWPDKRGKASLSHGLTVPVLDKFVQETQWHRIDCWHPHLTEKVSDRVKKRSLVYIEGKTKYKKYLDRNGVSKLDVFVIPPPCVIAPKASQP
ncbi:hypothetical protein BZG36_01850 [Bifiguratus adelaidae]|uniref:Uncharacterized protein n=1 Tax=Bifiguratus adelaidae TaxID=1938954 RepID=A0A261Y2E9_9FUNG|nr:hypothetical protein BZG36_01850 [Bifiguratus adelaidae]